MEQGNIWLPSGALLDGRYRIESTLGIGGYGITYKGFDTRLEQPVAIKEFFPSFMATRFSGRSFDVSCNLGSEEAFQKGLQRFREEAMLLVHLKDVPAIVRVSDLFPENNTYYMVMDFLDGKNLKQMADGFGGFIPADILIPVLSPIITALGQVHQRGFLHRDLSPDNIMMLEDGSVRLIDFGNARDSSDDKSMTLAMKEGFAPPEQYRSKGQGPYTDVYSFCATLYYCLTSQLVPPPMNRLTGGPLLRPSAMGIEIPSYQEDAIMDGLELFVQKRIQTMEELWNRLYTVPADYVDPRMQQAPDDVGGMPSGQYHNDWFSSGIQKFRNVCSAVFRELKTK